MGKICDICKTKFIKELWVINSYKINKCSKCGFIFINKKILKNDPFYEKFDYRDHEHLETRVREDARRSLTKINLYIRKSSEPVNLLDIGCGRGYFLDEARKYKWNLYGIDLSKKFVNYARKQLILNVKNTNIFNYKPKIKFDIITLNQVIEHLYNPNKLIKKCYSLLKNNGTLYIATPNTNSWLFYFQKEKYEYLLPPEHCIYFNKRNLRILLENNLMINNKFSFWSYPENFAGLIKSIFKNNYSKIGYKSRLLDNKEKYTTYRLINKVKILLFDRLFCGTFYKTLNLFEKGTNFDVLSKKIC